MANKKIVDLTTRVPATDDWAIFYNEATNKTYKAAVSTFTTAGSGGVIGPSGAVDSNIATFDGVTGLLIKDSGVATSSFAAALGADDNYVTDAEKIVIGNTSGTNSGDNATNTSSANLALSNLASVAINTTLVSDTDNTDDLGTTLKKWANLFVTTIGATATRVTKGWFTDLEVTNLPTVNGGTLATALSLGTMASETATNYVAKSLYDAQTIVHATTDNTPVALTVGEQTLVGRATGGNISAIAIDSDLSSVSANDDTVPSAKATKAMGDLKALLAGSTSQAFSVSQLEVSNTDTTITRSAAGVLAVEGVVIPSISSTNTITNKRKQPRVYSAANNASLTPEIDTYDIFHLTAMSAATTINNHSTSTPADGELMEFRFLDNATARALTWGTNYVAKAGVALPTTTTLSKNLTCLFEWNANLSKWNLLASGLEA